MCQCVSVWWRHFLAPCVCLLGDVLMSGAAMSQTPTKILWMHHQVKVKVKSLLILSWLLHVAVTNRCVTKYISDQDIIVLFRLLRSHLSLTGGRLFLLFLLRTTYCCYSSGIFFLSLTCLNFFLMNIHRHIIQRYFWWFFLSQWQLLSGFLLFKSASLRRAGF